MDRKWWSRVPLWVWWLLMALGGVAAVGAALWRVPWWIDHRYLNSDLSPAMATTVTGVRTAMVALGAGGLAVVGILYTHRAWHQTREGQVTDRYTKAIGQIASDKPVEQLGGIYALERIMRDSPKDHATIVEVLAAFVREHAPAPPKPLLRHGFQSALRRVWVGTPGARAWRTAQQSAQRRLSELVQAALTVLGRRPHDQDEPFSVQLQSEQRPSEPVQAALTVLGRRPRDQDEPFNIQLQDTDLRGANLSGAHLERAQLIGAHLEGTYLGGAHLERAQLIGAHLEGTYLGGAHLEKGLLDGAHLEGANLNGAHLEGANLNGAHLEGANLNGAYLEGAYLYGAYLGEATLDGTHLEGVEYLTAGRLVAARPNRNTHLSAELAADALVQARIAEVEEADRAVKDSSQST
ncbi:pentapeptide repeat-containing protein [Streptomyces lavendulocolor]|uniref:pentapeptide repeat-containing protein n=1 Tax=Streptomyces lavendulocolor TaxID=67316 RepID=UPI003C3079B6